MIRKFVHTLIALMLTATSALAQELPAGDARNESFREYFTEIVTRNRDIQDFSRMIPGTVYELPDGNTDTLSEKDTRGIWGREFEKWYDYTYDELLRREAVSTASSTTTAPPVADRPADTDTKQVATKSRFESPLWIVGMILATLVITFIAVWLWNRTYGYMPWRYQSHWEIERELTQDPVASGTPYVAGGIPPNEPERLHAFYEELAVTAYVARNHGVERSAVRPELIGPIESGMVSGEGLVGYNGQNFAPRRITQPIPAYRARYRFQDRTEDYLITLQGCMNPVRFGGGDVYQGFTFTPTSIVVPTPEPEQPAPAPEPVTPIRPHVVVATEDKGPMTMITVGRMRYTTRGTDIRVNHDKATGATEVVTNGQVRVFELPRRSKPRVVKPEPVATGTSSAS